MYTFDATEAYRDWLATRLSEHRAKQRAATANGEAYQRGMADAFERALAQLGGRRRRKDFQR